MPGISSSTHSCVPFAQSQACHRLEEELRKLRYELNGTQKALEVQANILQRARSEDSKRVREQKSRCQHLELQISRYKRQIEATTKISADYQRRYLQDIDEAKQTIQQDFEGRLRTSLMRKWYRPVCEAGRLIQCNYYTMRLIDAEAQMKTRFQEELEGKEKQIREGQL